MSIEDCLSILPRLFATIYSTPVEKQQERASKDKMRFNYLELQEQFKKIVQEAASDGSRENKEMADNGPNTCRTFVISTLNFRVKSDSLQLHHRQQFQIHQRACATSNISIKRRTSMAISHLGSHGCNDGYPHLL